MSSSSSSSPSRREVLWAVAGGVLLALAMNWPLVAEFGESLPQGIGDPLSQTWQLAWGGHALREQPLDLFQANQFWPGRNTLAYSDSLLGYAPLGMLGSGAEAAVARYDAVFLLVPVVCFLGAYLLARELGLARGPAVLAGIAFAYAPYRLSQSNHLHILSSGGIPLAVFLLLRGHRRGRPTLVVAGWLVVAWQLTLGWSLGLLLVYLIAAIGLTVAVLWWRRGRPRPSGRLLAAHALGVVALATTALLLSRPYLAVLDELPEARRTLSDVATYSGPVRSYLAAADESTLWGPLTAPVREGLPVPAEQSLFPGMAIALLAGVGLIWARGPLDRRTRTFLAIAIAVCAVLALGVATAGPMRYSPYRLLYELAPGFQAIRVPGRVATLTTLGLALLAGGGAQRVARALAERRGRRAAQLAIACLAAVVLFEGSMLRTGDYDTASYRTPPAEPPPPGFASVPGPALHLPAEPHHNRLYLLWSTQRFEPMVNGRSSVTPRRFDRIVRIAASFPDRSSAGMLRSFGVRTVVLHIPYVHETPWRDWRSRSIRGLGIRRSVLGELVVYDLRPPRLRPGAT